MVLAEITMRDGLQHEEAWIPTEAKIYYLQELAFSGVKRLDISFPKGYRLFAILYNRAYEKIFTIF